MMEMLRCYRPAKPQEPQEPQMLKPGRKKSDRSEQIKAGYEKHVEGSLGEQMLGLFWRPFEKGVDAAYMSSIRSALGVLGKVTKSALVDDDMPMPLQKGLTSFYASVWNQYASGVEDEIFETQSLERAQHRRSLAFEWAEWRWLWPSNRNWPEPYLWLRSRVLYQIMPADASFWQVVRTPTFFAVALAQMVRPALACHRPRRAAAAAPEPTPSRSCGRPGERTPAPAGPPLSQVPFYGIGIYVFVVLFVMINKTDEFQLVSFITRYKAIQFLGLGIVPGVLQSIEHYVCLTNVRRSGRLDPRASR